nr:family 43 glycosylhydrolase [Thermoactinomyces sp. CICC 10521]
MQDGADPWIYKHTDGWYYFTMTTGSNITIWRSKSITGLDAGEQTVVWTPDGSGGNCRDIWAPELHYLNGKWYIYYAATTCDGNNDNHRMFVLENSNADPFSG